MIRSRASLGFRGCLVLALSTAACASKTSSPGDETHFLCKVDGDCRALGHAFSCESGVCKASAPPANALTARLGQFCDALDASNGDLDAATVHALLGDAESACTLRGSDYDRSCTGDADCVLVGEGNACEAPCGVACPSTAINAAAMSQYEADYAQTPANMCPGERFCGCPCTGTARCVRGTCEHTACGAMPPP